MALENVYWHFATKNYATKEAFNEAVTAHNDEMATALERESAWNPEAIIAKGNTVKIQYEAWVKDGGDLQDNEALAECDSDAFEAEAEDDLYQVEIVATLNADNGMHFTALELLFKAHHQQANKMLGDHVFFEGMGFDEEDSAGIAIYYVACGS